MSSDQFTLVNFCIEGIILSSYMGIVKGHYNCRVPKGGVFKGGGSWGSLRIPREDWGTLGKIRDPPPWNPPLNNPII